jgi:hypothetical protein
MKDKHETLSDIGIQKSTLRNIQNTGGRGIFQLCGATPFSDKYQKDDQTLWQLGTSDF